MDAPAPAPPDAPPSRVPRVWANALTAVVSVVLTLAAVEAAVRFALRHADESVSTKYTEADPVRGWRHRPGARGRFGQAEYVINSRGLRDVEHEPAPASGETRVLILGDSFAEGFSVALEDGVARVLERDLRRAGCPTEVVNGGTVGYSTDQEYLFYRDEGAAYAPRVVVLLFYYNDILYNARAAVPGGVPKPLFTFTGGTARVKNDPLPPPPGTHAPRPWRGSAALTFFRERLRDAAPATYDALARLRFWSPIRPGEVPIEMQVYDREPPEPVVQAWLQTEHLLSLLQGEVAAHGAQLVVAYVPSKMETSRADWDRTRRRYRIDESLWDRGLVARRLEAAGHRLGIPVLDLTDALWAEQGRAYFAQGGHWNARGHAVAAQEIARFLEERTHLGCGAPASGGGP
ncbi:MAG TPA: SGNH/GDSL hydrolase family protein [Vicinamibacteria bacterium]|nr:SGNH/GDSL hydrolase family protein [Vicinamibacteria bacterium]